MVNAEELHDIALALRALQIKAIIAGSPEAEAFLAMTAGAIHDMAVKAEKRQPPARTVTEMMRRLGGAIGYSAGPWSHVGSEAGTVARAMV